MKLLHPGLRHRILQALDPSSNSQEREANLRLLAGAEHLPRHLQSTFLNHPAYPASKLVQRVQKLADLSPKFASEAKPLLDNLKNRLVKG